MANCDNCKDEAPAQELVIDHVLPRSHRDFNQDENLRMVHRVCHRRQSKWYWRLLWAVRDWFRNVSRRFDAWLDSWQPCFKESQGYRCQHRIMSNGRKECGGDE